MSRPYRKILTGACTLALLALGLMTWSLFDPRPMPVVVAMSVGQVLGTLSFGAFLVVVIRDVRAQLTGPSPAEREPLMSTRPPPAVTKE